LKKYLVDGPELKDGQKLSSGGIRENGRIVKMYSNPVPYSEKRESSSMVANVTTDNGFFRFYAERYTGELIDLVWDECFKPILRTGLRRIGQKAASWITKGLSNKCLSGASKQPIIEAEIIEK
jgi:hypothetical protein